VLVQKEISCLLDTVEASIKRKTCRQYYIRAEETLIVSKVANLIAKKEGRGCVKGETSAKRMRRRQRCRRCSKIRHNSCTCKVEIEDVDNSDASK
jgi:hypothetical protein